MRHLIVCCDGTWNRADQVQDGVPTPTNVRLFHNLLAGNCNEEHGQHEQVVRYFSGIGADGSGPSRLFDGGTANGLCRNIMNAYLWLARMYQPGDLISAVGFSRGAYTVRSLVAMLMSCGLVEVPPSGADPRESWRIVQRVFDEGYRTRERRNETWADEITFVDGFRPPLDEAERKELGARIEFLGVWDTVGALGVPDSMGLLNLLDGDHDEFAFEDTHLNPGVRCARHAVALDERRGPFTPTLWTTKTGAVLQEAPRVVQLWFPGVHADVGGGYREHGLSDGALLWMVDEASQHTALAFKDDQLERIVGDPHDVLHDSCVGFYERISPLPRSVPWVKEEGADHVHHSAVARYCDPPVRQDPYRRGANIEPGRHRTVSVEAHKPWCETGLYLEPGVYKMTAEGEWTDKDEAGGPDGVADPSLLGHMAYRFGNFAGEIETEWQWITGNPKAEVVFSKRVEGARWMQLVIAVANAGFDSRGRLQPIEEVPIGKGPYFHKVEVPGYLYAFANDAWGMYSNNRGSVDLIVERVPDETCRSDA